MANRDIAAAIKNNPTSDCTYPKCSCDSTLCTWRLARGSRWMEEGIEQKLFPFGSQENSTTAGSCGPDLDKRRQQKPTNSQPAVKKCMDMRLQLYVPQVLTEGPTHQVA